MTSKLPCQHSFSLSTKIPLLSSIPGPQKRKGVCVGCQTLSSEPPIYSLFETTTTGKKFYSMCPSQLRACVVCDPLLGASTLLFLLFEVTCQNPHLTPSHHHECSSLCNDSIPLIMYRIPVSFRRVRLNSTPKLFADQPTKAMFDEDAKPSQAALR